MGNASLHLASGAFVLGFVAVVPVKADGPAPAYPRGHVAPGHSVRNYGLLGSDHVECWFDRSRYGFFCRTTSRDKRAERQADADVFARTLGRNLNRMCDALEERARCVANPLQRACQSVRFPGFPLPIPCKPSLN